MLFQVLGQLSGEHVHILRHDHQLGTGQNGAVDIKNGIVEIEGGLACHDRLHIKAKPFHDPMGIVDHTDVGDQRIVVIAGMAGTFMVIMPTLKKMNGLLPPPLFAVPTTAGTGSETTFAAVITDPDTHDKFAVMDPFIRAKYAVLDPKLTIGLPKHITSTTGIDALTHAIEGYTNIWYNNKKFNDYGVKAVKLIFKYLERAYNDGTDIEARGQLLLASYYAGMCFTRGGVGYVHGIGHRLGGLYGVPHGLAMSVILPHVMSDELLAPHVYDKLAELADAVGITGATPEAKAKAFIAEIRAMNERMGIPTGFDCIKEEDVPLIAERAIAEICPTYPVKHFFKQEELEKFIKENLMLK